MAQLMLPEGIRTETVVILDDVARAIVSPEVKPLDLREQLIGTIAEMVKFAAAMDMSGQEGR